MEEVISPIIQTLAIRNKFTVDQLKEGISSWPKNLKTCVKRAAVFESIQKKVCAEAAEGGQGQGQGQGQGKGQGERPGEVKFLKGRPTWLSWQPSMAGGPI